MQPISRNQRRLAIQTLHSAASAHYKQAWGSSAMVPVVGNAGVWQPGSCWNIAVKVSPPQFAHRIPRCRGYDCVAVVTHPCRQLVCTWGGTQRMHRETHAEDHWRSLPTHE